MRTIKIFFSTVDKYIILVVTNWAKYRHLALMISAVYNQTGLKVTLADISLKHKILLLATRWAWYLNL